MKRAIVLLAFATGCSDAPLSLEQFSDEATDAVCHRAFECRPAFEPHEFVDLFGDTPADCIARRTGSDFDLHDEADERAIARGTLGYDPAAAERCVAEERAAECVDFLDNLAALPACHAALIGRVPVGEHCELFEECVPGAGCSGGTCARL